MNDPRGLRYRVAFWLLLPVGLLISGLGLVAQMVARKLNFDD